MYHRTALRSSLSLGVAVLTLAVSVSGVGLGQVPTPRPRRTQQPADTQQSQPTTQTPLENPNAEPPTQEPLVKDPAPSTQEPMQSPDTTSDEPAPATDTPSSEAPPSTDTQPSTDSSPTTDAPSTSPAETATPSTDAPMTAPDETTTAPSETTTAPAETAPSNDTTAPAETAPSIETTTAPAETTTAPGETPSTEAPMTTPAETAPATETPSTTSTEAPTAPAETTTPATEAPTAPAETAAPATETSTAPAETPAATAPATEAAPGLAPGRVTVTDSASPMAPRSAASIADGGLTRRVRIGLTFAETDGGMAVRDVAPRSAGESAGLKPGDLVLAINATNVSTPEALVSRLSFLHAGEPVTINVRRDGQPLDVQLVPVEAAREGDLEATVEYNAFATAKGKLRSVWSFPKGDNAPRPAVLFVRGVGAAAADAPGGNTFRDLAFKLARAGVIAVRYDPQGIGDSQGAANATVDFDGEVADARAALEHVRSDARVDPERVVVIGQGTGGGVAAVLASTDPKLAGLGVLGTVARPLMEYLLDSRRQQMALAGMSPSEVDDVIREHIAVYSSVIAGGRLPAADPYGIVGADGSLMGKSPAYWREYDRVNFSKIYSGLKMPVLNAVGEYDFVSTLADHRAVADALKARGDADPVLVVLPGADHDLRTYESREAAFAAFGSNDAPVNDRALSTIVEWVQAHVKGAAPAR